MTIRQTFDAVAINAILNDPQVLQGITDAESIDVTDLIVSGRAFAVMATEGDRVDGCYLFVQSGERAVEIHSNLLPHSRGRHGIDHTADAIEWAFANTDAELMFTQAGTEKVSRYAQYFGFKEVGLAPSKPYPKICRLLRLSILDWIDSTMAREVFEHDGLAFSLAVDGFRQEPCFTAEDALQAAYTGFLVRMIRHYCLTGIVKSARIYKEWATQAGILPIEVILVSRDEALVDVGDMVVVLSANDARRI